MRGRLCVPVIVAALFVCSATADAVELGGLQLSGGLSAGAGYNTNLFFQGQSENRTSAVFSSVRPHLALDTIEPRFIDYSARFAAEWQEFLTNRERTRRQGGASLSLSNRLLMNRGGLISVEPSVVVNRNYELYYEPAGDPFRSWNIANRLGFNVHPGGMRESRLGFSGNVGGFYNLSRYDGRSRLNRDTFGTSGTIRYNVVPKTALLMSGGVSRTEFLREGQLVSLSEEGESLFFRNRGSTRYTLGGGFSGAITRHLGLFFRIGNQWTLPDEQDTLNTLWILTQARLQLTDHLDWSLGYRRQNRDSSFGGYVLTDRIFTSMTWGRRGFSSELNGSVNFREFGVVTLEGADGEPTDRDVFGTDARTDTIVSLGAGVRQAIFGGFGVSLRYRFATLLTDYEINSSIEPFDEVDLDFAQHVVSLSLSYRF